MSYSSPLLQRSGAVELPDSGPLDAKGVAWHYGNPLGEQRAAATAAIVVDRSHRTVLKVSGPEAPGFLNNLLSQKLDDAPVGFTSPVLDLDIQGHILHLADVTRTADAFFLDLPADQAETFADFLQKMIFWSQVEVERTELALLTVLGPADAVSALPSSDAAAFDRAYPWPNAEVSRRDVAVPREQLTATVAAWEDKGARLAGLMAYTAERVRALVPEWAADLDNKSIPHEVPHWIGRGDNAGAVHLDKGCYRGQETVARVENLGRSPRVMVLLHLDGSAPTAPQPGDELRLASGNRRVGRIGTVVDDCDLGPIALGVVKRSALSAGKPDGEKSGAAALVSGETAATIDPDSLPAEEGPKAGRAAIDKLRGR